MNISCTQENLARGLYAASHVTGKNSSLPILSHVLLKADEQGITISATNLEIGILAHIRGKIEEMGMVALDAKVLYEYVNLLPREKVDLKTDGQYLTSVQCANFSTSVRGMSGEDFPPLPTSERVESIRCKSEVLKKALQKTMFAARYDEARLELSGVLFYLKKDTTLALAATDAYRLAEQEITVESSIKEEKKVIVPLRTAQELIRILEEGTDVEVYLHEHQVSFVSEGIEMVSKVLEGTYPDYAQIIPAQFKTTTVVDVKELLKAIKASSLFSKTGLNDVQLACEPQEDGKGILTVSSSNSTVGENKVALDVEMKGDTNDILLNYRFLSDGLQNLVGEKAHIAMIDFNSPCLVTSPDDTSYRYLVMPIRQ